MSIKPLSWTSAVGPAGVRVFELDGALYGSDRGYEFQEEIRGRCAAGELVVIDLRRVERIDSAGVGIILAAYTSAMNAGTKIALAAAHDHVERVLRHSWVLKLIPHGATLDAALEALR